MDCANCKNYEPVIEAGLKVGDSGYAAAREAARMSDWRFFRQRMNEAANVETKKMIYEWWREYRLLKWGPDRAGDCTLPMDTYWNQSLMVEDWWEQKDR